MEQANSFGSPKIALLIDFDNVILGLDDPGFDVELVVNALRERGQIVLGRCYGDWYRHNRHRRKLMEHGLELVETPAFGPIIKNSADIRIALDGYEIGMTQHHIDTFCIVSGDSDFLPLIKKLQFLGKKVLVICGNRFTSDMVRRNCNEFIAYENLLAASVGALEDATTLEGSFSLLHRAMAALRESGRDVRTSTLKQMMLQLNPIFSERSLGCSQFRYFLDKAVARSIVKYGPRDRISGELHVLLPEEDEAPPSEKTEARAETGRRFVRREDRNSSRTDSLKTEPQRDSTPILEVVKVESVILEASVPPAPEAPPIETLLPVPRVRNIASDDESPFPPRYDRQARRANRRYGGDPLPSASEAEMGSPPLAPPAPMDEVLLTDPELETNAGQPSPEDLAEHLLTRAEILSRGMRPGARWSAPKTQTEVQPPHALAQTGTRIDETPFKNPEIEAEIEAENETEAKPKRSRGRRRASRKIEIEAAPKTTEAHTPKAHTPEAHTPEVAPAFELQVAPETELSPLINAAPPELFTASEAEPEESAESDLAPTTKPKAARKRGNAKPAAGSARKVKTPKTSTDLPAVETHSNSNTPLPPLEAVSPATALTFESVLAPEAPKKAPRKRAAKTKNGVA